MVIGSSVPSRPADLPPLRPQGIGSPLPSQAWSDLGELRRLDPAIGYHLEAEYSFAREEPTPEDRLLASVFVRLQHILAVPSTVVVCFSWLKRGGAEWEGVQLVREAQQRYGVERVLVLVLDWPVDEARDWLPEGTRLCVLMAEAPELTRGERARFLLHHLASTRPALMVNCNSGITWDVFCSQGAALSQGSRLCAFIFCFDYSEDGRPIGYPESHLPGAIAHLSHVLSDNEAMRGDLARVLHLPPLWMEKVHAIPQPVELPPRSAFEPRPAERGSRPKVLWASRVCRQKRPELVREVAHLRPGYDFVVFGDVYEPERYGETDFETENLHYGGSFRTLLDLPTSDFDAFLYTALYDGMPNIVLAAGALGLPVVSAEIGGIAEIVDEETGWLVREHDDPEAYGRQLDRALSDPQSARRRAERLYNRIAQHHSEAAYRRALTAVALFP